MTDVHEPEVRSYNMSRIRGKDTEPEIFVRKFLYKHGFRYRLNVKNLQGKPDIVLRKFKTVIFIHGCFWHGHGNCRYAVIPKTRMEWWLNKINNNRKRDEYNQSRLTSLGWKVIIIWTCELEKSSSERLNKLINEIKETKY